MGKRHYRPDAIEIRSGEPDAMEQLRNALRGPNPCEKTGHRWIKGKEDTFYHCAKGNIDPETGFSVCGYLRAEDPEQEIRGPSIFQRIAAALSEGYYQGKMKAAKGKEVENADR